MRRLVIELTRRSLRAVSLHGSPPHWRVQRVLVEPLSAPLTGEGLQRLLKSLQPSTSQVISVIAREQTLTRTLKLPSTDPEELEHMVRLAAKAQLPYLPEHAATGWVPIDQHEGTSLIQLIACQRDFIDRHVALLRQAGVEIGVATPGSWGVAGWYQRFGKAPFIREPAMIVHVDEERTDLVLVRGDRVAFSRSLNQGVAEWRASLEPLLQELERSLTNVRKELPGMEAASVVLTGIGPLEEWRGMIEPRMGIPAVVRQGYGDVALPQTVTGQPISQSTVSFVVVLGLAFADTAGLVNLVPPDVRDARRQRRRLRELVLTAGLFLAALLFGTGVLVNLVSRKNDQTQRTLDTMHHLETMTRHTEEQLRDVRLIEGLLTSRRQLAEALATVMQMTPSEILFETVTFEQSHHEMVVRGSAPATRDVLEYLRTLKQDSHWPRVELRYSARRGSAADARTDFEIVLGLR